MINKTTKQKSSSPATSKMWFKFIARLILPEIYILSRMINCQLIPSQSGYDCTLVGWLEGWNVGWSVGYLND